MALAPSFSAIWRPLGLLTLLLLAAAGYVAWTDPDDVHWGGFAAMGFFYLLVFAVGAYAAQLRRDAPDATGIMLAGRSLPLGLAIFTMTATWVDGGYVNGSAEYTATAGLVWVQAPWGYALSLILGGLFFARRMRRLRFRTMLDPLAQRYGRRLTAVLFLPALSGELFWTAAILTALGATFSTVLGIDLTTSILLSAFIAVAYTALGGLWAVALTDLFQISVLLIGLAVVAYHVLTYNGGLSSTWEEYQTMFDAGASLLPSRAALGDSYWLWWDFAFLLIFGGIPWQVYFQRVLAARDEDTAVRLSILAGFTCLIAAIAPILIGMVGATVDWAGQGLEPPPSPAMTLPWVIRYLTSPWVAALGLGAVAAAVMSSVDSSVLSAASMASWNVYRPLLKPNLSEASLEKIIQRSIWIMGTAATLIAFNVASVYALWLLCSDFVYCLLFPALLCALFDPKANAAGALAGFLVAAFLRFGGGDPTLGLPAYLPYPTDLDGNVIFPFRTLAMVSGLVTLVVVSRLTQRGYPARELRAVED